MCSAQKWKAKNYNIFGGVNCIYNHSVGKWIGSVTLLPNQCSKKEKHSQNQPRFCVSGEGHRGYWFILHTKAVNFSLYQKILPRNYIGFSKHNFLNKIPRIYEYRYWVISRVRSEFDTLKAELNPICHLLALLAAHPILHVSWIRVKISFIWLTGPHLWVSVSSKGGISEWKDFLTFHWTVYC